ncbi:tumor necrosis factor receptor superfamily member 14-like isoform X2 [Sphaeramia orbicularis]|uniref:tumor necrosis factor receptor superfamily member 14-like isoform X2 n=1 Tax=Sphaeramia orbicularis TaxID=375764 RepID=UPI0011816071|nr:tumor necrosis factor receptor superfamily member 14-like isoform X2 [Sphaeramia orbicularis]
MKLLLQLFLQVAAVRSVDDLRCRSTEFVAGGRCCPMCFAGSYVRENCTKFDSTICVTCGEGTYMNQRSAQTWCHKCNICEGPGLRVKRSCTKKSDTVCEPQEGFYCTDVKDDSCVRAQKHRDCEKGQYIKLKGTSSADTECSPCTDGTFSDGTFTQCQPHTQCESLNQTLVNPGTSSTDAECEEKGKDLLIGIIVVILSLILAGAAVFYVFCWRKNKINKERRGETSFSKKVPIEESITSNPGKSPNIRVNLEVPSTEETEGTV